MTSASTPDPRARLRRSTMWIVGAGVLFAILAALIGQLLISWQLGDSQAVVARAAREVRQTFDTSATELKRVAEGMAARRTVARGLDSPEDSDASRRLFDQVAAGRARHRHARVRAHHPRRQRPRARLEPAPRPTFRSIAPPAPPRCSSRAARSACA